MPAKSPPQPDVLVLGQHPCAYVASLLLRSRPSLNVVQCAIPTDPLLDRLVLVNPAFFGLHPELAKLKTRLPATRIWGLQFLGDDGQTRSEHHAKSAIACVASLADLRKSLAEIARDAGVRLLNPSSLQISSVDERGLVARADSQTLSAKAALLAGDLPETDARKLALPESWPAETVRRYCHIRIPLPAKRDPNARPLIPMSLDLCGRLLWAWMLPGKGEAQLAIEQPIDGTGNSPFELLSCWLEALKKHHVVAETTSFHESDVRTMDVPAAGALHRESVANRTLLFGPAGGFFSACLEDVYPNAWSAVFAVSVLRKALKERHLQDALRPYREEWGTTLGEYLRGPQQNLRFLLPLVYRNPVMTSRLAESILLGKSVVR